jgi:hypothetical protein
MFVWCALSGLLGLLMTLAFIPDVNGMDLVELDQLWVAIKVPHYH